MRSEAFAQGYAPSLVDRLGVWLSARQIRRQVGTLRDVRVADFGCGYHASFGRSIVDEVAHLWLVDVALSEDLKTNPKITAVEGVLPEALAAFESNAFDVILSISVLEHLRDPRGMLRELHRMLAVGGTCIVNVPSWRGKRYLEYSAFKLGTSPAAEMDDHKMYYDVRDLWPLLVEAGFLPSQVRCFPHKLGLNTLAVCGRSQP